MAKKTTRFLIETSASKPDVERGVKTLTRVKKPPLYKVVMLNDDFTPMDFVVHILQNLFQKSFEEATEIMLAIHHKGAAICGVYSLEVAETKANQAMQLARRHDHPLKCTIEVEG